MNWVQISLVVKISNSTVPVVLYCTVSESFSISSQYCTVALQHNTIQQYILRFWIFVCLPQEAKSYNLYDFILDTLYSTRIVGWLPYCTVGFASQYNQQTIIAALKSNCIWLSIYPPPKPHCHERNLQTNLKLRYHSSLAS